MFFSAKVEEQLSFLGSINLLRNDEAKKRMPIRESSGKGILSFSWLLLNQSWSENFLGFLSLTFRDSRRAKISFSSEENKGFIKEFRAS